MQKKRKMLISIKAEFQDNVLPLGGGKRFYDNLCSTIYRICLRNKLKMSIFIKGEDQIHGYAHAVLQKNQRKKHNLMANKHNI